MRRTLLDESPDPVFSCDSKGRFLYVNRAFASGLGMTVKEIVGRSLWDVAPRAEADQRFALLGQSFKTGSNQVIETRLAHGDGDRFYLSTLIPLRAPGGKVTAVICSAKDITDRKRVEEALRMSEARLGAFMEFVPALILIKDRELRPVFANSRFREVFPFDAWQGKRPHELFPAEVADRMVEMDTRALESGSTSYEESWQGQDGVLRHYRTTKFRIEIREAPPLLGAIIIDVSDMKRAGEERAKLLEQLAQVQKMESVGRLAGGVAHDFNNMLQAILGYAELAISRVDPEESLHSDLEQIQKTAWRSAELTRKLLAFARKQPVAPRILDLNDLVAGSLKMLRQLVGDGIEVAWTPGKKLGAVKMDPAQVDQVLSNLCANSRDALGEGGRIRIQTGNVLVDEAMSRRHPDSVPGEYVALSLSDNGRGIDREAMAHLFEPFFTTKEGGRGTGLGLATVYGIIRQNGGFIDVGSEPGRGTTFRIFLPRHAGSLAPERDAPQAEAAPSGRETILLVEDEPSVLDMCRIMLLNLGYRVLAAGAPSEAIRLAGEHKGPVHLLVSDVILPEMNGRELARAIHAIHPDAKRLFMSGYTNGVFSGQSVLDAGMDLIHKPFSFLEFATRVRGALDR